MKSLPLSSIRKDVSALYLRRQRPHEGGYHEWEFADVGAKGLIDVLEAEENRRIVFEPVPCGAKSRQCRLVFLSNIEKLPALAA